MSGVLLGITTRLLLRAADAEREIAFPAQRLRKRLGIRAQGRDFKLRD